MSYPRIPDPQAPLPSGKSEESDAERIFYDALCESAEDAGCDIEELCRANPLHATRLRALHACWVRASNALRAARVRSPREPGEPQPPLSA